MPAAKDEVWTTGRRKEATARVRLRPGTGKVTVNHREFEVHFKDSVMRAYIAQPFVIAGVTGAYDVIANIRGGGTVGQAGALRHGIARALVAAKSELRGVLKESGMLTRDARVKERKKYGQPGARRRFQFSKR